MAKPGLIPFSAHTSVKSSTPSRKKGTKRKLHQRGDSPDLLKKEEPPVKEHKLETKRDVVTWQEAVNSLTKLRQLSFLPLAKVWYAANRRPKALLDQWIDSLRFELVPLTKPTYVQLRGKTFEERRRTLSFADSDVYFKYSYSGRTCIPMPWKQSPTVNMIREQVWKQACQAIPGLPKPNFCLVIWYRYGTDYLGAHSDDESDLVPGKPIISFSLGCTRRFLFHNKDNGRKIGEVNLSAGDMVIMGDGCQKNYKHSIPKMKCRGDRWCLTFRYVNKTPTPENLMEGLSE